MEAADLLSKLMQDRGASVYVAQAEHERIHFAT